MPTERYEQDTRSARMREPDEIHACEPADPQSLRAENFQDATTELESAIRFAEALKLTYRWLDYGEDQIQYQMGLELLRALAAETVHPSTDTLREVQADLNEVKDFRDGYRELAQRERARADAAEARTAELESAIKALAEGRLRVHTSELRALVPKRC